MQAYVCAYDTEVHQNEISAGLAPPFSVQFTFPGVIFLSAESGKRRCNGKIFLPSKSLDFSPFDWKKFDPVRNEFNRFERTKTKANPVKPARATVLVIRG